jgi:hypothetical protein
MRCLTAILFRVGLLCLCASSPFRPLRAEEPWQLPLSQMPLRTGPIQLNRTNAVDIMLRAFQSNAVVKALVFMPGATDEFYMFRRARANLTNESPSLLDAVAALTNQTLIRATFHPPLLLLHTAEDLLEPQIKIQHPPTADKFKRTRFLNPALYNDRDWDSLQPIFKKTLKVDVRPWRNSYDSWHFYRHSFAGWNLSGWEALEAAALAGESGFTVLRNRVVFEYDRRIRTAPKFNGFLR